jgi:hypothetical protein
MITWSFYSYLEADLEISSSLFLVSQLLSYSELTISRFLHDLLELQAPSLDLLKCHLQGPNLLLGVHQVFFEVILTLVEVYNIPAIYPVVSSSNTEENK